MFFIKLFGIFTLLLITIIGGVISCTLKDQKSPMVKYGAMLYFVGILTVLLAYGKVIIDSAGIR